MKTVLQQNKYVDAGCVSENMHTIGDRLLSLCLQMSFYSGVPRSRHNGYFIIFYLFIFFPKRSH